jgi:transcriptional regulator
MYIPEKFVVDDAAVLHDFMDRFGFAVLVTAPDGVPTASHLPFLLDRGGERPVLQGHMARADPQWRDFAVVDEALVVFQGPHAYISPSWYETTPMVPTWNFTVVHAYGKPALIEDDATVRALLSRLVDHHESALPAPWSLDEVPADFIADMLRGVVAFEIPIARLEGKFKLSQNRRPADREGARRGLAAAGDPAAAEVARLMAGAGAEGEGA